MPDAPNHASPPCPRPKEYSTLQYSTYVHKHIIRICLKHGYFVRMSSFFKQTRFDIIFQDGHREVYWRRKTSVLAVLRGAGVCVLVCGSTALCSITAPLVCLTRIMAVGLRGPLGASSTRRRAESYVCPSTVMTDLLWYCDQSHFFQLHLIIFVPFLALVGDITTARQKRHFIC
jgi:hypothetical protein